MSKSKEIYSILDAEKLNFNQVIDSFHQVYKKSIDIESKLNEVKTTLENYSNNKILGDENEFLKKNITTIRHKDIEKNIEFEKFTKNGDYLIANEIYTDMDDTKRQTNFGMENTRKYLSDEENKKIENIFGTVGNLKTYSDKLDDLSDSLDKLFELVGTTEFGINYVSKLNMFSNKETVVDVKNYKFHKDLVDEIYYINNGNKFLFNTEYSYNLPRQNINDGIETSIDIMDGIKIKMNDLQQKIETSDKYNIDSTLYDLKFMDDIKTDYLFQIGGDKYYNESNIYLKDGVYPKNFLDESTSKLSECFVKYNMLVDKINMFNELLVRYFNFRYYLFKINTEKNIIIDYINIAVLEFYYRTISQILNNINKDIDVEKNAYFDIFHLVTLNFLKYNIAPLIGIKYNPQNIDHEGLNLTNNPTEIFATVITDQKKVFDPTDKLYTNLYVKLDKNIFYFSHFKTLLDKWIVHYYNRILISIEEKNSPYIIYPSLLNLDLFNFLASGNHVKLWINNTDFRYSIKSNGAFEYYISTVAYKILARTLSLIPYSQCDNITIGIKDICSRVPYIAPQNYYKYKLAIDEIYYKIDFDYNMVALLTPTDKFNLAPIFKGNIDVKNLTTDTEFVLANNDSFIRIIEINVQQIYNVATQKIEIMFPVMKKYEFKDRIKLFPEYAPEVIDMLNTDEDVTTIQLKKQLERKLRTMYARGDFNTRNSFEFVKWVNSEIFRGNNEISLYPPIRPIEIISKELLKLGSNHIKYHLNRFEEANYNKSRKLMNSFLGKMRQSDLIWLEVKI